MFVLVQDYYTPMNDLVHLASRETDTRKGRQLEYFTLGWNLTEAVVGSRARILINWSRCPQNLLRC
jgi:hypothetical protein